MNWGKVFRALAEAYGWTFETIAHMSLGQIRAALGDDGASRGLTYDEVRAHWARRRRELGVEN